MILPLFLIISCSALQVLMVINSPLNRFRSALKVHRPRHSWIGCPPKLLFFSRLTESRGHPRWDPPEGPPRDRPANGSGADGVGVCPTIWAVCYIADVRSTPQRPSPANRTQPAAVRDKTVPYPPASLLSVPLFFLPFFDWMTHG